MDRIVPITAIDLISMYGTIMRLASTSFVTVEAATTNGEFELTKGSGNFLATEPVKKFTFGSDVSAAVIYFVPAYDYEGFVIDDTGVTPAEGSVTVVPDGKTLYSATLLSGTITIAKVSL